MLIFLSRVAFICNLFFVLCLLLRHTHFSIPAALNEFVIITGWVLSVLLNFGFEVWIVVKVLMKKPVLVPKWLIAVNTFFFVFQLVYRLNFTF